MEKNAKYPRRPKIHERLPITLEQIQQLLEAAQEHPLKALLTVAITTGIRRGELLGLRWQDVDFQHEILHVRRMIAVLGERESTETRRTIALPEIVVRVLKEHRQNQEKEKENCGRRWHDLDLVFANEVGQHLNIGNLWQQYHAFFVDAGLSQMRFHDLRNCTIIFLVTMGVTPPVIHAILGFRWHNTSVQTLTPVSLSMQKEAMKTWDALSSELPFESHVRIIQQILPHQPEAEEE